MTEPIMAMGAAFWLGILTSISPCPLSTNIAAISYVSRRIGSAQAVLCTGMLYMLGRVLAYVVVAVLVIKSLLTIPGISNFLQNNMSKIIGPICLAVGLLLLDLFNMSFRGKGMTQGLQARIDKTGVWGAGILGILFALAFCPTSAGLYFGGLIPLAVKNNSVFILPMLYGAGTALPVIGFALLLAFGAHLVGSVFNKLTVIELWVRRATAVLFILAGIYLILTHNLGIYLGF